MWNITIILKEAIRAAENNEVKMCARCKRNNMSRISFCTIWKIKYKLGCKKEVHTNILKWKGESRNEVNIEMSCWSRCHLWKHHDYLEKHDMGKFIAAISEFIWIKYCKMEFTSLFLLVNDTLLKCVQNKSFKTPKLE